MAVRFNAERDPDVIAQASNISENYVKEAVFRAQSAIHKSSGLTECLDCGDDIPAERLEAYPAAERCIACQSAHEQRTQPR